jgi:hypothetical protein
VGIGEITCSGESRRKREIKERERIQDRSFYIAERLLYREILEMDIL